MSDYTEDTLIEQPAIEIFGNLSFETINCYAEIHGSIGTLGREMRHDIVLIRSRILVPAR